MINSQPQFTQCIPPWLIPVGLKVHLGKQQISVGSKWRHNTYDVIDPSLLSYLELDQCIGTPIYIGRYDDVADVSYRQNSADIYQQYLLMKVLRCCSAWSVGKPKLLLHLWPWL